MSLPLMESYASLLTLQESTLLFRWPAGCSLGSLLLLIYGSVTLSLPSS